MRKIIASVLVAGLAALVIVGCGPTTTSTPASPASGGGTGAAAKTASVGILEFNFSPKSVTVAVGGTVTWTNSDAVAHTVTGDGWKSAELEQGATYARTFETVGTFAYACSIHPSMTGEVVVK